MIVEEVVFEEPQEGTNEIPTVPRQEEDQGPSVLRPKCLFPPEQDASDRGKQPVVTVPTAKKRKYKAYTRTRICTETGKRVLSSDMRLHLQKLRQLKVQREAELEQGNCSDEELRLLEQETRRLQEKLEKHKEIRRLQLELQQTSISHNPSNEEEDEDYEDEEDRSTESVYSRPTARRQGTTSSGGTSQRTESSGFITPEELARMQEEMAQMRDYMRTQSGFEAPIESPLVRNIEIAKIDRTLKTLSLDHFDGSSDPSGFLNTFDGRMAFYGHSETARCQFFSTCLQGTALRWYNNLPPRSIDSRSTLKSKFQTRFSSNYKWGKITASLMIIRHRPNESLRNFLARFRDGIAKIPDLIEELAINYLAAGIDKNQHSTLLEEFFEKNPRTLHSALLVEYRMTLQEVVGSIQSPRRSSQRYDMNRTHSPRTPKRDTRRDSKYSPQRSSRERERSGNVRPRPETRWQPRPRPEKEHTKLNADKATVLAVLKTEPDYRPPRPMKPGRPPSSRYCEYHEDTGHTTEQCFQLSNLIESKIRRGKLVHFTENDAPIPREGQRDDDRVIDVIFGGIASGGSSNNSRKSYVREILNINPEAVKRPRANPSPIISFPDEDYSPGMIENHQDALVITTKVGAHVVKKILIDNGSSVDILYHHAFS